MARLSATGDENEIRDRPPGLTSNTMGGAFDENGNVIGGTNGSLGPHRTAPATCDLPAIHG
ncbi:MAG: hypothetical protein EOO27_35890 [Comamonadaceae bacterium]|nr:MAG: hypothetical protein EOO27_35890 [Comamonadaceae bacterium]